VILISLVLVEIVDFLGIKQLRYSTVPL